MNDKEREAAVETAVLGLKDAGCYQDIALVPSTSLGYRNKRWATSDEEDGSIEFMTDEEVITQWADYCAYLTDQKD